MIGLAMFLALAGTTDATPASPPIIVTTKSSTLCNAVRNVVAPSLRGLMVQDSMLDRGRSLLQDMSKMRVARADLWIEFENARLLNVVDDVASNNLKVHQLLDTLAALQLKDPSEAAELAALRGHLMEIADRQADALNDLSGTADSTALDEIQSFKNPMAMSLRPDSQPDRSMETQQAFSGGRPLPRDFSHGNLFTQNLYGSVAVDVAMKQSMIGTDESNVTAVLQPLIDRCR